MNSLETFLDDQLDVTFNFKTGFLETLAGHRSRRRPRNIRAQHAFYNVPTTSLLNPDESQPFSGNFDHQLGRAAISISFGAYAVDTVRLGRHIDVIGGLRFDRFDTDYNSQSPTATSHFSRVDQQPSYRAALVYKPVNYGSVYFEYGTSSILRPRPGALTRARQNLPPENNQTYEVGTKWDLPSKATFGRRGRFSNHERKCARNHRPPIRFLVVLAGNQRVNGFQCR